MVKGLRKKKPLIDTDDSTVITRGKELCVCVEGVWGG